MTLGMAERQGDLLEEVNRFCERTLPQSSVFAVLHRERDRLFPDELFADLFSSRGRRSVPPSVVATVMVLQRLEGAQDVALFGGEFGALMHPAGVAGELPDVQRLELLADPPPGQCRDLGLGDADEQQRQPAQQHVGADAVFLAVVHGA
jgi:hypothetical protein